MFQYCNQPLLREILSLKQRSISFKDENDSVDKEETARSGISVQQQVSLMLHKAKRIIEHEKAHERKILKDLESGN